MSKLIPKRSLLPTLLMACVLALAGCASTHKHESTGQYLDNSAITAKVKAQLLSDPKIRSFPITVNTYKGTVQLSGFVNNYVQKQRAEAIARSVPGVTSVDNALQVKRR